MLHVWPIDHWVGSVYMKFILCVCVYLQSTLTLIRFDTVGGTPFDAIQRYAPMSRREIFVISMEFPSHSSTAAGSVIA